MEELLEETSVSSTEKSHPNSRVKFHIRSLLITKVHTSGSPSRENENASNMDRLLITWFYWTKTALKVNII